MNKDELRKKILNVRNCISNKGELSIIISNKIINLDIYRKAKVIALYYSLPMEVDTKYLINESLKNKDVLLPRIIDDRMVFIKVNKGTIYSKSTFKVLEPLGEEYCGKIDLIIVPGVVFDNELSRIGYGKGYYDKYLSNNNIYKIGICFSEQIVDLIPIDDFDIKMDMVITENRVYKKKT